MNGIEKYKLGKIIGGGSYGNIIECEAELQDGNMTGVVKQIKNWEKRMTPLLEPSIMSGLNHPNLHQAISIFLDNNNLYIFQEKAKCDMRTYLGAVHKKLRRSEKYSDVISITIRKKWSYSIAQAVLALHKIGVIHADIKSSNILLFADGTIKLTDFGMSVKKVAGDEVFSHRISTITHTAPEVLQNKNWNEKADIWSLACVLHEIMYGALPFPYQGVLNCDVNTTKSEKKTIDKYRTLNCIETWAKNKNMSNITYTPRSVDYIHAREDIYDRNTIFDDLLLKMLQFDPRNRIDIYGVMRHEFFSGMSPTDLGIHMPVESMKILDQEVSFINSILRDAKQTVLISEIFKICKQLVERSRKYFLTLNTQSKDDYISWLYACLWLANISVTNELYFTIPAENSNIIRNKFIIGVCEYLKFNILLFYEKSVSFVTNLN